VSGTLEYDPRLKVDRLASGVLEFGSGASTFICSTQLINHQRVDVFGTRGSIEIETPFTPLPDQSPKIRLRQGSRLKEIVCEACNQYTAQGDLFSQAILNDTSVPTPLDDGVANMKVIDGIIMSSKTNSWITP
jgi:predicted dehydrogenase